MSKDQQEIYKIAETWSEVRLKSREEVAAMADSEKWLEAYDRYNERFEKDMSKMMEIADRLKKLIEPEKVEKKTKGQRKRDAYARKLARSGVAPPASN
jgi:tRNA(Phe) wybutosine-synthesizing methylase Tyw3